MHGFGGKGRAGFATQAELPLTAGHSPLRVMRASQHGPEKNALLGKGLQHQLREVRVVARAKKTAGDTRLIGHDNQGVALSTPTPTQGNAAGQKL